MHPQILGFLRFSFFGPSDTKLDYSDRQAAFERLYSPRRMETRFQLFEHMVLPGFRAQTDPDFKLVVLSSAVMPEGYRTRLTQLCASLPQIELVFAEGESIGPEVGRYTLNPAVAGQGLLQFRCDDDDAISQNFIATLRSWAPHLASDMLLTMPKGLMLWLRDGKPELLPMFRPHTGAGYAFYASGPSRRNVFGFSHIKSGRRFPSLSDPRLFAYIQSFTDTSDTAARAPRKIAHFLKTAGVDLRQDHSKFVQRALQGDFAYTSADALQALLQQVHDLPQQP